MQVVIRLGSNSDLIAKSDLECNIWNLVPHIALFKALVNIYSYAVVSSHELGKAFSQLRTLLVRKTLNR